MGKRPKDHLQGNSPVESLLPETPSLLKTQNTNSIRQTLKFTQHYFPIDVSLKQRFNKAQSSPGQSIVETSQQVESDLSWLRNGLVAGYNRVGVSTYKDMVSLITYDRAQYSPNRLNETNQVIMSRIHSIQEYFARGIIALDDQVISNFYKIFPLFQPLQERKIVSSEFIKAIFRTMGRIMEDTDQVEKLLLANDGNAHLKELLQSEQRIENEPFKGYRNAILYRNIAIRMLGNLNIALNNTVMQLIDEEGYQSIMLNLMVPLEANLEKQQSFGVGINVFSDPSYYSPPAEDSLNQVLDLLTKVKTNIIPGGSIEYPVDYQARMTEGMRMHDAYGINNVHIIGQHPQPVTESTPLLLHIAMERSSQPPLYAYYNIRAGELFMLFPDITNSSGIAELHLHLYALVTDLRHLERSGVSYQGNQEHKPSQGKSLTIPLKRSYVIGKSGIHEEKVPTDYRYITPREWTLPYGAKYTAALLELDKARSLNDAVKIQLAQAEVTALSHRLPSASKPKIKQKYIDKAVALGLGQDAFTVKEGRFVSAAKEGFRQPVFTETPIRRDIRVIPKYTSKTLQVNALLTSGGDFSLQATSSE